MIFGKRESILRKGYNYDLGVTVVEQVRKDGTIFTTVYVACGPIIHGNGRSFEDLCKEYRVSVIKEGMGMRHD